MPEPSRPVPAEPAEVVREGLPAPAPADGESGDLPSVGEAIEQPAKVMRVGTMMKQLLDEVRQSSLDESSRDRLREIYATSIDELGSALSADLREELDRLMLPFPEDHPPSQAELQVAKAQLVGWLEGLIQGIQAALFAQQVSAQQQLANMRGKLPAGTPPPGDQPVGTYL
ncbi:proteasome activator [Candidatus Poriferisocius sp.]|uniref:proteasome activator n=1 Tax=Candidatus Poriferisocius sp. TaxID=3101276 RepID=UPI003B5CAC20